MANKRTEAHELPTGPACGSAEGHQAARRGGVQRRDRSAIPRYAELIGFVQDRTRHDLRYAISKIRRELGWRPRESFASGLEKTVCGNLERMDAHFAAERV